MAKAIHKLSALGKAGRNPKGFHGSVNPPVYHTSTVIFENYQEYCDRQGTRLTYGLNSTPTMLALEEALVMLEATPLDQNKSYPFAPDPAQCGARVLPSGLAAIMTVFMAYAETGAHFLISDSVYDPTRNLSRDMMKRLGVNCEFFDPLNLDTLAQKITSKTKLIFLESPGSLTMDVHDIPSIVDLARSHNIITAIDNTWGNGLHYEPMVFGVDISLQAGTKYITGASDALLGTVVANERAIGAIHNAWRAMGSAAGPDDIYAGLKGLRSMAARLALHEQSGLKVAKFLEDHKAVRQVSFPALASHPQHSIWKRDFHGACSLLSFQLKTKGDNKALSALFDAMDWFKLGFSWGGFESLITPFSATRGREYPCYDDKGQWIRIHVGQEHVDDLIEDLSQALHRWQKATG